jgi:predicted nucleic acid-binding protein
VNVLLDTDIAIEILRARDQSILSKWMTLSGSSLDVCYSPVLAAEIWAGALPHEHQLIAGFFRPLNCVMANYETGRLAGDFLRQYAKSHGVEVPDAFIAASAVQHRAHLWTRNRRHYPMPQLTFY